MTMNFYTRLTVDDGDVTNLNWSVGEERHEEGDTTETVLPAVPKQKLIRMRKRSACIGCGRPSEMNASFGPACPDCYDNLSG